MSFIIGNHLINVRGCILCCFCETRVSFIEHYLPNAQDLVYGGYFNKVFHVVVPNNVNYRRVVDGNTLANVYCINCRILLGWELIAVAQPSQYYVVGRFFMRLKQIMYLSGVTLHDSLFGGANEQAPNEQDGGAIDQVGGVNEQNHDEDGRASMKQWKM
ncbi:hypothetical protein CQW23_15932 [Capsicum baccatum]|uniref:Yippee domain-containing protein n=1 Tax=Capsicum baccatum TaxID=33114 RepID=A0A2G2WNF5_CAPBA|nr:hypothetical protein CQW23_15932 [Capsicum baccatum]